QLAEHVRAHGGESHDARGEGSSDLRVDVLQSLRYLRELGEPAQIGDAVAQLLFFYGLQRLGIEEARPEAGVIDDEVELRPVARRLRQVGRCALLRRAGRGGCQALVDADVEEAGMLRQLLAILFDQLESR